MELHSAVVDSPLALTSAGSLPAARPCTRASSCWRGSASRQRAADIMHRGREGEREPLGELRNFFSKLSLNSNVFINWQPDHCLTSFRKPVVSFLLWQCTIPAWAFCMCQHQVFLCACLRIHNEQRAGKLQESKGV